MKKLLLILFVLQLATLGACTNEPEGCLEGLEGCPCFENNTCMSGLVCGPAGRCDKASSSDDSDDTGDGNDTTEPIDPALACTDDIDCQMRADTLGQLCTNGSCTDCQSAADCVASGTYGASFECSDEGRCTAIPSCAVVGCPEGGVCDDTNGRCRESISCAESSCALSQLCEEATSTTDASCLPECEEGKVWNGVDEQCDPIPVNCHEDWPESILSECASMLRACVEVEGGAECGECYQGYKDADGGCTVVLVCSDLSCESENRMCQPEGIHSDAQCGACLPGYPESFGECKQNAGATCESVGSDSILDDCIQVNRSCVADAGGAGCGDCLSGMVEDPETGLCELSVVCADLGCEDERRGCEETWNGQCTECITLNEEDPTTGECVCIDGYLPDADDSCVPVVTCEDIQSGCDLAGEYCIEATAKNHAFCQKCPESQTWYAHWQTCLICPPCMNAGETGRVFPTSSLMGHCVCETQPGYYHSESGLGGTYACDADSDGWVNADARLPIEAPEGSAEKANARCDLRTIDRILLFNENGEQKEVLLSSFDFLFEPVALYEPLNRDRPDKLNNDYEYDNPLMANYAPAYGAGYENEGRPLMASELNPFTKGCATDPTNGKARWADYNANGIPDVDDLGAQDTSADAEARIFAIFSYFQELYRGYYYEPDASSPHGTYVIAEKGRNVWSLPGWRVALKYSGAETYWRECHRHTDSDYDESKPPFTMDFANYGEDESCDYSGDSNSWCGMNHHSQFKCLLATTPSETNSEFPHHLTPGQIDEGYQSNICYAKEETNSSPTPAASNPSTPEIACSATSAPSSDHLVWGVTKYKDYGHEDAPADDYSRGCINECVESALLPPEDQCQGLPPISCSGRLDDYGKLFCFRPLDLVTVPLTGQSFVMGSPEDELGRDAGETQHTVNFENDFGYSAIEVMTTEATQDQFIDYMGFNPSRFVCDAAICPVEQVTLFDAMAFANILSDRQGLQRCYEINYVQCADGEDLDVYAWDDDTRYYTGEYCQTHGGIIDVSSHISYEDSAGSVKFSWQCDGYRLPTEAEWEYLARAGTQSATYGGDLTSLDCNTDPASSTLAWYCGNASSGSQASGALLPNAFGLYDMLGNVHEWVLEIFGDYSSGTQSTPEVVPSSGWYEELLVARGGAWNRGTQDSRAARRVAYAAGARNYALGFRLVRSLYDFDFSRYTLIPSERSWEEAEADCQSRGDHLLSITTHRENMLIRKMVGLYNVQYDTNFGSFWTGLNDREDYNGEDNWVFSDGSSLGEEFWYWSADSDDDRDCVYSWLTDMRQSRSWLAYYCSNEFSYICEAPEI